MWREKSQPFPLGKETVSHGLCLGSWACQDPVTRVTHCGYTLSLWVCFCQVRDVVPHPCYSLLHLRLRWWWWCVGRWVGNLHTRCPDTRVRELSHREWDARFSCVSGPWSLALGHDVRLPRLTHIAWNGLGFCLRH